MPVITLSKFPLRPPSLAKGKVCCKCPENGAQPFENFYNSSSTKCKKCYKKDYEAKNNPSNPLKSRTPKKIVMKIKVRWSVNMRMGTKSYSLEDLGLTQEEWESLSEDERRDKLQEALDNEPEQPYMSYDSSYTD